MFLNDFSVGVHHERSWKRGNSAIFRQNLPAGHNDRVINAFLFGKSLYLADFVGIIHGNSDHLQTILITSLQIDELRNFLTTGRAPGGPEIQQYNFAMPIRCRNDAAGDVAYKKSGSWLRVARESNDTHAIRLRGGSISNGSNDARRFEVCACIGNSVTRRRKI